MDNKESLLIKDVFLYNDDSNRTYDIYCERGKIRSIKTSEKQARNSNMVLASGLTAIPGIIDIHIHGAGGADSLDGSREAFETISKTLAKSGTTSFITTMIYKPHENNIHLKAAAESVGRISGGAEILGIYIEGPFISKQKRGGIAEDCIIAPSEKVLDDILNISGDHLKLMCLAPEIPGNLKLIKLLRDNNIIAAFGHSDADYEEVKKGFDAGISHVTHFFNAMRPLHHRDPGPIPAILENKNLSVELIADSHHVHPSLINLVRKMKPPGKIVCITDGISGTGLPEGIYTYNNRQYESKNGLASYLDGTFIGSVMSLAEVLKNYMVFTGSSLKEAVDTVSINPARLLGVDDRKGSIESAKDADIVLLDNEYNVRKTIIAGKEIR